MLSRARCDEVPYACGRCMVSLAPYPTGLGGVLCASAGLGVPVTLAARAAASALARLASAAMRARSRSGDSRPAFVRRADKLARAGRTLACRLPLAPDVAVLSLLPSPALPSLLPTALTPPPLLPSAPLATPLRAALSLVALAVALAALSSGSKCLTVAMHDRASVTSLSRRSWRGVVPSSAAARLRMRSSSRVPAAAARI